MNKTVFDTNYERLEKLGIYNQEQNVVDYKWSRADGFMDLVVERIPQMDKAAGQEGLAFSLTHYFEQNGDLCKDPDMQIVVYPKLKMVEVLTFEMSFPPVYQEVYPEPGKFNSRLKKDLNSFLRTWLKNLIDQGHGIRWSEERN